MNRLNILDLFRFLAAFMVVIYHYFFRGFAVGNLCDVEFTNFKEFAKYAYLGVDLFFIISGFVIVLSIEHSSIRMFWISRFIRLYPLYWFFVSITTLIILLTGNDFNQFKIDLEMYLFNLSMLQDFFGVASIDGVYWSLAVELKFYVIIITPFILLKKYFNLNVVHFLLVWLLFNLFLGSLNDNLICVKILKNLFFLKYSYYFMAGIMFYCIRNDRSNRIFFLMLLVVFVMAEYHALLHSFEIGDFLSVNFSQIVVFCVVAFIFLVFLMFSLGYLDFLNFQTFRILGSLTFPLYLIHQNVGYIILNAVNPFVDKNLLVVLVILGMCVFSYFVNRWFELHIFLRLRKILNSLF